MSELDDVIAEFGLSDSPKSHAISKDKVIFWMGSKDIEVLGAIYNFVSSQRHLDRVVPKLTQDEVVGFMLEYFGRCLREDPDGEWAHTKYAAMRDFVGWFRSFVSSGKKDTISKVKRWLGSEYIDGDHSVRLCIVNGALEHLFETRAVKKCFDGWREHPVLRVAYDEASHWWDMQGNCMKPPWPKA